MEKFLDFLSLIAMNVAWPMMAFDWLIRSECDKSFYLANPRLVRGCAILGVWTLVAIVILSLVSPSNRPYGAYETLIIMYGLERVFLQAFISEPKDSGKSQ